jgi:hypothetical protein
VAVSGVLQDPSTYAVTGTTLTFSAAPPTGTGNISVRFLGIPASGVTTTAYRTVTEFTATAGQTTFSVPSYTVGFIDVYRNGVLLGSADYTASNGVSVVLANGATAGDLVEVISMSVSSVLNAIPASPASVNTTNLVNGSVTQAKVATGVAGTGPAFSATRSGTQSIANNTFTKIQFNAEEFDTNSNYDSTTNFRFTPTVAGYYQVNGSASWSFTSGFSNASIYKNGSQFKWGNLVAATTAGCSGAVSALIYLNGSTDYIELFTYQSSGLSQNISTSTTETYFQASMVRAA